MTQCLILVRANQWWPQRRFAYYQARRDGSGGFQGHCSWGIIFCLLALLSACFELFLPLNFTYMKLNKTAIWYLIILIIAAAVYRVIPNRPFGFAPHIAMALFGGAVIKDRKWAFALPLFSICFGCFV
jgi:hypothetical protein